MNAGFKALDIHMHKYPNIHYVFTPITSLQVDTRKHSCMYIVQDRWDTNLISGYSID